MEGADTFLKCVPTEVSGLRRRWPHFIGKGSYDGGSPRTLSILPGTPIGLRVGSPGHAPGTGRQPRQRVAQLPRLSLAVANALVEGSHDLRPQAGFYFRLFAILPINRGPPRRCLMGLYCGCRRWCGGRRCWRCCWRCGGSLRRPVSESSHGRDNGPPSNLMRAARLLFFAFIHLIRPPR